MAPEIPKTIGGFEILDQLGQGGMGVVYRARDNALKRELAIKLQIGDWQRHPAMLQRFLREAQILARINHPNVVNIFSVGEHEGAPFFVMELLDSSLADAARLRMPSIVQLKRWMLEAARGLAAIHEVGVIHRDIKPANLLLTRATSVEDVHVKVADLGIASAGNLMGAPLTRAGAVLGTSGYLAPEAFRLERTLDARADQYSLGIVFYELLAKRGPFQDVSDSAMLAAIFEPRTPPDVREFRPEVDEATALLLARMLADDPDQRFATTPELVQALAQIQGDTPSARVSVSNAPTNMPHAIRPTMSILVEPPNSAPASKIKPLKLKWPQLAAALFLLAGVGYFGMGILQQKSASKLQPSDQSTAALAQTAEALQRESWAKYLLSHYQLKTTDVPKKLWLLDLLEQRSGVIAAELVGPTADVIELTGRVDTQQVETIDGEELDVYQLTLLGTKGSSVSVRIAFSETETSGEGSFSDGKSVQEFEVTDSEELED
jgi:serine/threonine protein kinase